MLMAEAFSKLLKVWDRGDLPNIPKTLIADEIIVSLYQVLVRTLMTQDSNGSWGTSSCREANAYATLTISKASILPFLGPIEAHIGSAIEAAQAYLLSTNETTPSYLWVEKVTYGSAVLTKAYVLAALNASSKPHSTLSFKVTSLVTIPRVDIEQLSHICFGSQLSDPPEAWKLQAAFIEGSLFGPYLGRLASENSPRKQKYGALVAFPFVWVACNYMGCNSLSTSSLRQGMRASLQSSGAASGNSKQESPVAADIIESANEACTRVLGIAIPMASTTIPHHPINPLSYGFTTNLPGPFLRETTTSSDSFSGLVPSVQDCIPSRAPRLDRRFSC